MSEQIGQLGPLEIFMSGVGVYVNNPDNPLVDLAIHPDERSPEKAFYIVRWDTLLDRVGAAPLMGRLALAEEGTDNYLLGSEIWPDKVPAESLEAEAIKDVYCRGIRVEQQHQTILWRLPVAEIGETGPKLMGFLTSQSDLDSIIRLAEETVQPDERAYVRDYLPLFHRAYTDNVYAVTGPPNSRT